MTVGEEIPTSAQLAAEKELSPLAVEPELWSTDSSSTVDVPRPSTLGIEDRDAGRAIGQDKDSGDQGDKQRGAREDEIEVENKEEEEEEEERAAVLPPRPDIPPPWAWRCHKCHSYYALGVTNRCLADGHYYCYGLAQGSRHWERKKRQTQGEKKLGTPCGSSFDYAGWENMSEWQRAVRREKGIRPSPGCWQDCTFPSECRRRRLYGIPDPSMFELIEKSALSAEREPIPAHVRPELPPCTEEDSHAYESCDHLVLDLQSSSGQEKARKADTMFCLV
ncbi:hypothetical protein McanMca71_007246 [Microsporum canis]